jgi:diphthine-ammonia ligase
MKFVGLISGGKDSIFSIQKCLGEGHQLVCVANLKPEVLFEELNSYMYQSAGAEAIEGIAQCLDVPLVRRTITGKPVEIGLEYAPTDKDEVEDMFELLRQVKAKFPEVQAVSSGAILSTYQKNRVEEVCGRLGLVSLSPLWKRDQILLLKEMVDSGVQAILIRVASYGLKQQHLGKTIGELQEYLVELQQKYDCQCCGEGGEYESLVIDCPIYKRRLDISQFEVVTESDNPVQFSGRLTIHKFSVVPK